MKPFSKNLFSQTPVAFGWLHKETINLDISVCVYVCELERGCVFMCMCCVWVGDFCCFVLSHRHKYEQKQINLKMCACLQTCNNNADHTNDTLKLLATKTQHLLITYPFFLSSFYTFTSACSPNATPKHPSMSTTPTPIPASPYIHRDAHTHTWRYKKSTKIFTLVLVRNFPNFSSYLNILY